MPYWPEADEVRWKSHGLFTASSNTKLDGVSAQPLWSRNFRTATGF